MLAVSFLLAAPFSGLLGGLLPLDAHTRAQWPPAGAWRLPVGDPYAISSERPAEPGPFFVLRGVEWDGDRAAHQGADIGCGRAGDPVRAAAAGIVVRAADHGEYGGYGTHVVVAHRLADGVLAYSVYAHLRMASLRVRAGQRVQAGQVVARVGATGRVTAPHLHFEVRIARDPGERWELTQVEDPLAFVEERLPTHRGDTTGVECYLEWGENAGLLGSGARADDALTRETWWRMLAAAVRGPVLDPGLDAGTLHRALVDARVLAREGGPSGGTPATWSEVARDVGRLRALGVRTGHAPLRRAPHRTLCESQLGSPAPASRTAALTARSGRPTVADGVVLIADLGGPRPEPPKPKPAVKRPLARRRPSGAPAAPGGAPHAADSAAASPVAPDTVAHRR